MVKIDYIAILSDRIKEYLSLMLDDEKKVIIFNIVSRHTSELNENIIACVGQDEQTTKFFKNYINRILSTVEALNLPNKQYMAARKAIQNDIYSCLKVLLEEQKVTAEKKKKLVV